MKLQVTSTASSKKGHIYISTKKIEGETPANDEILFCFTEDPRIEIEALKKELRLVGSKTSVPDFQ
jgi:hypothetical protein